MRLTVQSSKAFTSKWYKNREKPTIPSFERLTPANIYYFFAQLTTLLQIHFLSADWNSFFISMLHSGRHHGACDNSTRRCSPHWRSSLILTTNLSACSILMKTTWSGKVNLINYLSFWSMHLLAFTALSPFSPSIATFYHFSPPSHLSYTHLSHASLSSLLLPSELSLSSISPFPPPWSILSFNIILLALPSLYPFLSSLSCSALSLCL